MKRVANKAKSFREAEAWDIKQQIEMTPQERMRAARALKDRAYPPPQPDVREWHRKNKGTDGD